MTSAPADVVCVGNAIVDVLAPTPDETIDALGLVKGTMRLVDAGEAEQLYAQMGPATEVSGGAAANTAAGLALLGAAAHFVGKVADDQLGKVFTHDIRAVGVGFDVSPAAEGSTGRCLVMITPDAQRTMSTSLGVAGQLGPADIDVPLVAGARWTYLEGFLWDPPPARAALQLAASEAAAVAFSLSDPLLVERHRDELLAFCSDQVDLLFGNEEEVKALAGEAHSEKALEFAQQICRTVVMTRSERGSVVASGGGQVSVPAAAAAAVVDTTGAGDLYAAGYLAGLCRGLDPEAAATLGSEAAASIIARVGARADPATEPFSRR